VLLLLTVFDVVVDVVFDDMATVPALSPSPPLPLSLVANPVRKSCNTLSDVKVDDV
jgi:hypothetical protein